MKRTKTHQRQPSPALANTTICPECQQPTGSPGHVCAPKAVQP